MHNSFIRNTLLTIFVLFTYKCTYQSNKNILYVYKFLNCIVLIFYKSKHLAYLDKLVLKTVFLSIGLYMKIWNTYIESYMKL